MSEFIQNIAERKKTILVGTGWGAALGGLRGWMNESQRIQLQRMANNVSNFDVKDFYFMQGKPTEVGQTTAIQEPPPPSLSPNYTGVILPLALIGACIGGMIGYYLNPLFKK